MEAILCPDVEIQLVNFIEFNQKLFNSITIWPLLLKI